VLINANNKMVPDGYPYLIAAHWQDPYRANRIRELIAATPQATPDTGAGATGGAAPQAGGAAAPPG
jgi:penicillin amidase